MDVSDNDNQTVWHLAIEAHNAEALQLLFSHCECPKTGDWLLPFAVQQGLSEIVSLILDAGFDTFNIEKSGYTPLHHAVRQSSMEKVHRLLEARLDPNARSAKGETPLMHAATAGHVGITEILLLNGGHAELTDNAGCHAGHYACTNDRVDLLSTLRETKINWDKKAKMKIGNIYCGDVTVLHLAATREDCSVLRFILDESLVRDVNGITNCGETALFMAASRGINQNVSLLLSNKADSTIKENRCYGYNPLHIATRFGFKEVVSTFVTHECDVRLPEIHGLDCEMIAWKYGHDELAGMLKICALDQSTLLPRAAVRPVSCNTKLFMTPDFQLMPELPGVSALQAGTLQKFEVASEPLRVAIESGDLDLCKRVVDGGADLDVGIVSCLGCTPLLYSLHMAQPRMAEYLALQGASITGSTCESCDTRGYSVLHYAASRNYHELLRILLEKHLTALHHTVDPVHPLHLAILNNATECVRLMLFHASTGMLLNTA